ncbi:MAG: CDP-alcohol phosphatidyltransferase family protein [Actinobacteria bacterium]|nr:CDP-alcohol phosphatidyltransferase family protein [Actinomycetota bacterium]
MWTIPNAISFGRLLLVPWFLWLVFVPENYTAAGLLLGFIGGTDWIDGYLARRLDQVSKVGEFLDPLADRLAVAVAVIGGLVAGVLPVWFGVAIIVREVAIAVGALVVGIRARDKLEVRYLGKVATALLYSSIPGFFVLAGTGIDLWNIYAYALGVPGLVAYYYVAAQYLGDARSLVRARTSAIE